VTLGNSQKKKNMRGGKGKKKGVEKKKKGKGGGQLEGKCGELGEGKFYQRAVGMSQTIPQKEKQPLGRGRQTGGGGKWNTKGGVHRAWIFCSATKGGGTKVEVKQDPRRGGGSEGRGVMDRRG